MKKSVWGISCFTSSCFISSVFIRVHLWLTLLFSEQREACRVAVDEVLAADGAELAGGEEAGDRRLRHRASGGGDVVTRGVEQVRPAAVAAEQQPARGRLIALALRLEEQPEVFIRGGGVAHLIVADEAVLAGLARRAGHPADERDAGRELAHRGKELVERRGERIAEADDRARLGAVGDALAQRVGVGEHLAPFFGADVKW